ncbi:histone-lysine N-methyltransferase SETMAR-like [Augochlora pura]
MQLVGRPVVENLEKITKIIEVDRHVSSRSIAQELNIDHKTVLNHLHKAGFKKKLDVWMPHQLTQKNMMDRTFICDVLAKRNEIDPFLKRMVIGDEKWITYDIIVRKQSWSKFGEDNVRPHTSIVNCQKIQELGGEILMHPPYSPDLAPSNYRVFLVLQTFLSDQKWASRKDCVNRLQEFFANRDQDFYERGIMKPP